MLVQYFKVKNNEHYLQTIVFFYVEPWSDGIEIEIISFGTIVGFK